MRLGADGALQTTTAATLAAGLTSFHLFAIALVGTILPALIDLPRAQLDWLVLARTVAVLANGPGGWPRAHEYLSLQLADKVPLRKSFAPYDERILIGADTPANVPAGLPSGRGSGLDTHAGPPAGRPELMPRATAHLEKPDVCRKWSLHDSCTLGAACPRTHACLWKACTDASPHAGRACAHKPKDAGGTSAPKVMGAIGRRR